MTTCPLMIGGRSMPPDFAPLTDMSSSPRGCARLMPPTTGDVAGEPPGIAAQEGRAASAPGVHAESVPKSPAPGDVLRQQARGSWGDKHGTI